MKAATLSICMGIITCLYGDYAHRETEYNKEFCDAIELVCDESFLCTGGKQALVNIFETIDLSSKTMLDFGCGLGGPARFLAQRDTVSIEAVDIEPYVITEAQRRSDLCTDLKGSINFSIIKPGIMLPFAAGSFDVIYTSECVLHIKDKQALFADFFRVLKPGGMLILNDWMHASADYRGEVVKFLEADGLTWHLTTPQEYGNYLKNVGFHNIIALDTTWNALDHTLGILKKLEGAFGARILAQYDQQYLDDFISSWQQQADLFKKKELLTYVFKAFK